MMVLLSIRWVSLPSHSHSHLLRRLNVEADLMVELAHVCIVTSLLAVAGPAMRGVCHIVSQGMFLNHAACVCVCGGGGAVTML